MLNIIQNTIGAIRRVGESVVRAGLKMWLPFTKAEPLGGNLVINGDFSDGTNGWTASPSGSTFTVGTHQGRSDVADINITDTSITSRVTQSFDFVEGRAYLFSIDVYLVSGSLRADTIQAVYAPDFVDTTTTGVWQTLTAKFVAGSTQTANIFLRSINQVSEFYVDNVSIEEYAQETPDISGNDNNAILKTGKCLVFDGNDSVETSFPSSKTIKTIAFWIYPTHSANFETLFNLGITNIPVSPLGDRVIQLNHLTISNKSNYPLNFDVYIDGVYRGETNYNGDNPTLLLNQWQRVVLVNSNGTSTVNDTFDVAYTGSGSHGRFKMSDLQIYGAEFTTDDIAYDYANPQKLVTDNASSSVTLNDLHAWWHMSEGDGTIAFDSAPLIGKEFFSNYNFSQGLDTWEKVGVTSENVLSLLNGNLVYTPLNSNLDFNKFKNTTTIYEANKTYRIEYQIIENTGLSNLLYFNGNNYADAEYSVGTHIINFKTSSSVNTTELYFWNTTPSQSKITFKYISVKEVFNIDGETYDGSSLGATYDDAQERIPQLGMMNWSKGSNLLEYSEDFSNNYWDDAGVTLDSGYLAPDGTMSAYKLSADVSGSGVVTNLFSGIGSYYRSIWAKTTSGTGSLSLLTRHDSTGSVVTITNEWQRFTINSADSLADYFYVADFRAGNLDEVILWGAQLENADSVSAYRRTNGTAVTDATLISSATDSQKDILGNAVRVKGSGFNLDGTGYGEVLHNTDFDFGTGDFSVSAWVKFSYIAKGSSFNAIYTNGGQTDATNTFSLTSHSAMKIVFLVNTTDCSSTSTFNQGEWVHVVATRNSGTISLYINGNKTPEQTRSTVNSNATVTSTQNPRIGSDIATSRFYENVIDDVQVYEEALTPDEVEQNYNATKSGHNN